MSDPVTNVEIEDVLSSIRRLVSEETRKTHSVPDVEEKAPVEAPERLVLTPALRVKPEDLEAQDEAPETDSVEPDDIEAIDEPVVVDEAPFVEADEVELPMSAPHPFPGTPALTAFDDVEAEEDEPETVDLPEIEEPVAALPEADVTEEEEDHDAASDPALVFAPKLEPFPEPDAPLPMQEAPLQPDAGVKPPANASEAIGALTEKLAELEAKIGRKTATAETAFESAPQPTAWQEPVDLDDAEDEADAALRAAEELNGDFLRGDEAILDEETLRELVTDIVREELQGVLGERITRNVRKLVRREIHRALAAQDLG